MKFIEQQKLEKIQIAQGYANCSIAVLDEKAVIVTDKKIAQVLESHEIDVLCLEDNLDIKLWKSRNEYSSMKGFIGGAIARLEDKIVVFGDLRKIDKDGKIRKFMQTYDFEIVDFEGLDVVDYGGILNFVKKD